jgi:Protein of unknown function (DUF2865)
MSWRSRKWMASVVALGLGVSCVAPSVQAQDFFSNLFGGFGARPPAPPQIVIPFGNEGASPVQRARASSGGSQAWCVRTCDGRAFPVSGSDDQGRTAACNGLCPASETKIVYGSDIDDAATEGGKRYSELPNAFRYRKEIVAGCTCNGKDQFGLAQVSIENDPTVRKGDIVAGPSGLVVADRNAGKHASMNFSPASETIKARYRRVPVVASQ